MSFSNILKPRVLIENSNVTIVSSTRKRSIIYCENLDAFASYPNHLADTKAVVENNMLHLFLTDSMLLDGYAELDCVLNTGARVPSFIEIVE